MMNSCLFAQTLSYGKKVL